MTTTPTALSTDATLPLFPTQEEQMLRESVRGIVSKYGPSYWQRLLAEEASPTDLMKELGSQGYLGVHLPEEYEGGGLGLYEMSAVLEETAAAGCPALTIVFSAGVTGSILARHATPEQNDRWLRGIANGTAHASFAITEPDAGTNSHKIKTTAKKVGDKWILSGQKYYVSGVEDAAIILVVARTHVDKATGRGKLSLFVVDADAEGLSRQPIPTGMNIPEQQWTLYFDDIELDEDRLIGGEHQGFRVMFDGLNPERILVGAVCTGVGRYALDRGVSYAKERSVWDVPIGSHQAISHPLARAKIELEHARLMSQKAARLFDLGQDAGEASNMGKLLSAEAGLHCLDRAIQTHGGNGVAKEYQLTDYWFLVRMLKIGPVSEEMILNHVAERTLGLPKSY